MQHYRHLRQILFNAIKMPSDDVTGLLHLLHEWYGVDTDFIV